MNGMIDLNWNNLSKYRRELYGVSVISVILLHYFQDINNSYKGGMPAVLVLSSIYLHTIRSIGVDIFLFLSGVGLYFSLKKKYDIKSFYVRRIKRVGIVYLIYGIVFWLVYDIIVFKHGIVQFLCDLSLLSFWSGRGVKQFWYIALIIPCYLIYPAVFKVDSIKNKRTRTLTKVIIAILSSVPILAICIVFPAWFENTEIAMTRILVFLIGCFCARLVYERENVKFPLLMVSGILVRAISLVVKSYVPVILLSSVYPFNRWIISWVGIGVMFLLAELFTRFDVPAVNSFLRITGDYSLEVYITHVSIRALLRDAGIYKCNLLVFLLIIFVSVIISWCLRKVSVIMMRDAKSV